MLEEQNYPSKYNRKEITYTKKKRIKIKAKSNEETTEDEDVGESKEGMLHPYLHTPTHILFTGKYRFRLIRMAFYSGEAGALVFLTSEEC
jgi:hypothetical protein